MGQRSSEQVRIELIRTVLTGADASRRTVIGIGDDAAVIAPSTMPLVWTVDAQVEGVHFRRDLVSMEDLGYRATMAAASDLGAMGATPVGMLSALVLPIDLDDDDLEAILRGQRQAADQIGAPFVGGNLSRGNEISITTTVLGEAVRPLTRSGAQPGNDIVLAGPLGLSGAGLLLLQGSIGKSNDRLDEHEDALMAVRAFKRPVARITAGLDARDVATSAIDISDGLARDVGHVARASGVRMVLDASKLVTPELERAAALSSANALSLALTGGEDYALVMTMPAGLVPRGFIVIGRVLPAEPTGPDVVLELADGSLVAIDAQGYDHFASRPATG